MMTLTVDRVDALVADRRVRIGAGILAGVCVLAMVGLAVAANNITVRETAPVSSALPERPLNLPVMRWLPPPQPMLARGGASAVAAEKPAVASKTKRKSRSSRRARGKAPVAPWLMSKR